ncbi:MAG: hypothetical protein WAW39_21510 [Prosthecobacter sp.]|uniref:hypothetical protein n=1 Tax=Prosthecobacter sp. TaxID=1965333 RepID=UPI003BB1BA99
MDFETTLLTGDLLFVKNSTGTGTKVCNGVVIPNGIQLRPFKRGCWCASKASHVLRIIPEGK